jgi:hypothetical protein
MKTDEIKSGTCRWCQSKFEYTEAEKPALPCMCWKCAAAALAKFESQPPRRREQIPFTRL